MYSKYYPNVKKIVIVYVWLAYNFKFMLYDYNYSLCCACARILRTSVMEMLQL